jgi:hypothetical protein
MGGLKGLLRGGRRWEIDDFPPHPCPLPQGEREKILTPLARQSDVPSPLMGEGQDGGEEAPSAGLTKESPCTSAPLHAPSTYGQGED